MDGWIDGINLVITKRLGMTKVCCEVETFSICHGLCSGLESFRVGWRVFWGFAEEPEKVKRTHKPKQSPRKWFEAIKWARIQYRGRSTELGLDPSTLDMARSQSKICELESIVNLPGMTKCLEAKLHLLYIFFCWILPSQITTYPSCSSQITISMSGVSIKHTTLLLHTVKLILHDDHCDFDKAKACKLSPWIRAVVI